MKSPPLFPPSYIVKLARADVVLDFWALLHRKVVIRSLVLQDSEVNLVSDPDGPWNSENSEPKNSKSTSPGHHRERGDESGAISGPWVVSEEFGLTPKLKWIHSLATGVIHMMHPNSSAPDLGVFLREITAKRIPPNSASQRRRRVSCRCLCSMFLRHWPRVQLRFRF